MYKHYVFDINMVFKENHGLALKHLDKMKLMKYTARGKNPKHLRQLFEEMLVGLEGNGVKRSVILEKWLVGEYTSKECKEKAMVYIEEEMKKNPKSTTMALMKDICNITFTWTILSQILVPEKEVVQKMEALKKEGKEIYLAGNMDAVTFKALREKNEKIFMNINSVYISGESGKLKPEKEFYKGMVSDLTLNAFATYVVDENKEDLEKCRETGLTCGTLDTVKI
jgi:FMN phosphatase YigB (HAD superfamily)